MTDTFDFHGFQKPLENWSKLPHEFFDVLSKMETKSEICVILYIMRNTWGYGDYEGHKDITMDEFMRGRKRRDGTRIDRGCQMSEPSLRDGLRRAEAHGFIDTTVRGDAGRIRKGYALRLAPPVEDRTPAANGLDGERNLPRQGKNLSPPGKGTLPRSEKETLKETKKEGEAAPKNKPAPAAPPPGIPAAIHVFWKSRGRLPTPRQQTQIVEAVGEKPADLELWGKVLDAYEDAGWNPKSVSGPLDYYGRREIPSALKNAKGRDRSRAQKKRDIRKYWDDKLKGRQVGPDEKGSTE